MSLILPASTSPLRALFDVSHLAEMCAPSNRAKLPTLLGALQSARDTLRSDKAIRMVHLIALRADGHVILMECRRSHNSSLPSHVTLFDFGAL